MIGIDADFLTSESMKNKWSLASEMRMEDDTWDERSICSGQQLLYHDGTECLGSARYDSIQSEEGIFSAIPEERKSIIKP